MQLSILYKIFCLVIGMKMDASSRTWVQRGLLSTNQTGVMDV